MWKMQTTSPAGDNTLCGKCLNSLALLKILTPENNKIVMTQSSPHKIQMKRPYLKIWLYRYKPARVASTDIGHELVTLVNDTKCTLIMLINEACKIRISASWKHPSLNLLGVCYYVVPKYIIILPFYWLFYSLQQYNPKTIRITIVFNFVHDHCL